jgi:hypothetical protein
MEAEDDEQADSEPEAVNVRASRRGRATPTKSMTDTPTKSATDTPAKRGRATRGQKREVFLINICRTGFWPEYFGVVFAWCNYLV